MSYFSSDDIKKAADDVRAAGARDRMHQDPGSRGRRSRRTTRRRTSRRRSSFRLRRRSVIVCTRCRRTGSTLMKCRRVTIFTNGRRRKRTTRRRTTRRRSTSRRTKRRRR